jgi:hypothetical protein
MIQITIDENEPLGQFILAQARETGQNPEEIAMRITSAGFEARVSALHERYMQGEFSQGHMAEMLGLSRLDLIHLLHELGLPASNI